MNRRHHSDVSVPKKQQLKFSKISYKEYSDFEFNIVDGGSTWYLHKSILQKRCPRILTIDKESLKSFNLPEKAYEALITFIYQDKLINMDFLEMIDFHLLLVLCQEEKLANYIAYQISTCSHKGTRPNIALAFSKLIKYPKFNPSLFDALLCLFSRDVCSKDNNIVSRVTTLIIESPTEFLNLAMRKMLLRGNKQLSFEEPENPFGGLRGVVIALFPSIYKENDAMFCKSLPCNSRLNSQYFTIKCQDRAFTCHKLLLVLRWPYFEKVMSFNGLETTTNTLEIPADTLTPESVETILNYLYTNDVSHRLPLSIAHNILQHAGYFEMIDAAKVPVSPLEDLIASCRSTVFQPLTAQSCIGYLKGALEYGTDDQLREARNFISNIFGTSQLEIIRSEFKTLSAEECHRLLTISPLKRTTFLL